MKMIIRELDLDRTPVEVELDMKKTPVGMILNMQERHKRLFGEPFEVIGYEEEESYDS